MVVAFFRRMILFCVGIIFKHNSNIYNILLNDDNNLFYERNVFFGLNVKIYPPYRIGNSKIGDYTYISKNSTLNNVTIGKFCSIGPNLIAGWGIHPTNGISTHPMFYSVGKQNGITLSDIDKINERKPIVIGNDVFIGMNVLILDGVIIGDGAIIGAGAVVSKDIPPYGIAVGNPIKVIKFRFNEEQIKKFLEIKWWDFNFEELKEVERYFYKVDDFIERYKKN
nr:CatB-related O-acetyltransferase [uncultured Flavobacterium sp.]